MNNIEEIFRKHNLLREVKALEEITSLIEELEIRQISGFEMDIAGQWWKLYPTHRNLVTDELLLDALNVRQEAINKLNKILGKEQDAR